MLQWPASIWWWINIDSLWVGITQLAWIWVCYMGHHGEFGITESIRSIFFLCINKLAFYDGPKKAFTIIVGSCRDNLEIGFIVFSQILSSLCLHERTGQWLNREWPKSASRWVLSTMKPARFCFYPDLCGLQPEKEKELQESGALQFGLLMNTHFLAPTSQLMLVSPCIMALFLCWNIFSVLQSSQRLEQVTLEFGVISKAAKF